jgi:CBS domain-containing protein
MPTVTDVIAKKGKEVVTAPISASVLEAARLMNDRGIGGVVVTENGRVVGIFSERDILRRVVAEQRDPSTTVLRDVMTTPVVDAPPDTTLEDCRAIMTERRIRHIPILDGDVLCGIITIGDILASQVREQENQIAYLNAYVYDLR